MSSNDNNTRRRARDSAPPLSEKHYREHALRCKFLLAHIVAPSPSPDEEEKEIANGERQTTGSRL